MNNSLPQRRRPAHGVHIYLSEPTIVWLSVCTKNRKKWLDSEKAHQCLLEAWRQADAWMVGRYILMPDHLHLFCAPVDLTKTLTAWVTYWKRRFTQAAKEPSWQWQAGYWDTRLRRHENYTDKWRYAIQNAVEAGLVNHPEEWPYQGEMNELRW